MIFRPVGRLHLKAAIKETMTRQMPMKMSALML
jgi:hypothetical protein